MRARATAATAALLLAALTACGGGDGDGKDTAAKPRASADKTTGKGKDVDCTDQTMDQAEWMEHCADGSGTGGDGTEGMATGLTFGETYEWADGLKVTVVDARLLTTYDPQYEPTAEGLLDFRVRLKLENVGQTPADLGELSTIVEGATSGGRASGMEYEGGAAPLEGQLAPGSSVTKTDDNALGKEFGRKILVRVQRASEGGEFEFPEFEGEITG